MAQEGKGSSRRDFLGTAVAASAVWGGLTLLGARSAHGGAAPRVFKAGLIGCGGRGGGAAKNCIAAAQALGAQVRVVALADAMPDRLNGVRTSLKQAGQEIADDHCFTGFDAYKKLCATDVDLVLLCTSPNFRPLHVAAAVAAGKHVFMEKPVAVDAPGCRKVYQAGEQAAAKKLSVVAGTCLRHGSGYAATHKVVAEDKAIGKIVGGVIWYCTGRLWANARNEKWSDAEYLVRNWANFCSMSGDHIVEQYVHTLDMLDWHMGAHPIAAAGFGGRARRKTGDQYDFFSNDLEYPDKVHIHGCCRQIQGCWGTANAGELMAEKGACFFRDRNPSVRDAAGKPIELARFDWRPPQPGEEKDHRYSTEPGNWHPDMYTQEHIVLLDSLLKGQPINDTVDVTDSTLACIMSRIAAYTGQKITWDQLTKPGSEWYAYACTPAAEDFEKGEAKAPPDDVVPIPGSGDAPRPRPARPDTKKGPRG